MCKGGRVPCVLKLAQHLLVRKNLARVLAAQPEQLPEECRLVDPREKEDVPGQSSFDEGFQDVLTPSRRVLDQGGGARIRAEEEISPKVPVERLRHLVERPMGNMDGFEPTGETLVEAVLHEQLGRA